jgi:ketosteroid isomerase-like protein
MNADHGRTAFRRARLALLAPLGAWLVVSCAGSPGTSGAPHAATDRLQLEVALQLYAARVLAMDSVGIASQFAPDGEIVNAGAPPVRGPDAIRHLLGSFAAYHVLAESVRVETTAVRGDSATQEATFAQRVRAPDGRVLEPGGRLHVEWIRRGGRWWIRTMGSR